MNSYNTDMFFSNYYNLQSVHFEFNMFKETKIWWNYVKVLKQMVHG